MKRAGEVIRRSSRAFPRRPGRKTGVACPRCVHHGDRAHHREPDKPPSTARTSPARKALEGLCTSHRAERGTFAASTRASSRWWRGARRDPDLYALTRSSSRLEGYADKGADALIAAIGRPGRSRFPAVGSAGHPTVARLRRSCCAAIRHRRLSDGRISGRHLKCAE